MQKILIISSKGISSRSFDGAEKRIFDIAKFLSKKNRVDFICIDNSKSAKKNNYKFFNKITTFQINFFVRILNSLFAIIKFYPIQKGFFYSKKMFDFVSNNKNNYDVIIFHLIRSAQYLPEDYYGKTILEMTDLGSENYNQIIEQISPFNPIKYLYFLEKILLRKYEKKVSNNFDKVIFISKNELSVSKEFIDKNRIKIIGNSVNLEKKLYKYKTNNYKILFIGNINYLPNKIACYNFSKNILPKLNKIDPNLKFSIIGKINLFDKFFLRFYKNVEIHGPTLKLDKIIYRSICGLCNLDVATGIQNKIFTYMSYGLPAIVNKKSHPKSLIKKDKEILVFNDERQLKDNIFKLIRNKKLSKKISTNSYNCIKKKFSFNNIYAKYAKIVKSK